VVFNLALVHFELLSYLFWRRASRYTPALISIVQGSNGPLKTETMIWRKH